MAVRLANLARVTTPTVGTGTITLGPPVATFLSFAQAGVQDGDTVTYALETVNDREIGRGVYNANGAPTLTRSEILRSTNNNTPINLNGNAQCAITPAAEDFLLGVDGGVY
jgi:hypothetical protein